MKKVFALVLFAFCLLSSHQIDAQNTLEINNEAAEITANLKKHIKFNTAKEDQVYQAYVTYNRRLSKLNGITDASEVELTEAKKKFYLNLCNTLQNVLSEEQYAMFELIEKRNQN